MARDFGEVCLAEMTSEKVTEIVGPGAVWPKMDPQTVAEEVFLEIKAGSSGRPNKTVKLTQMEKLAPFLIQVPGIKPQWLAEYMLTEMDEGVEIEDAVEEGMPSITALNTMMTRPPAMPGMEPGAPGAVGPNGGSPGESQAQGATGANNAPAPEQSGAKTQGLYRMAPPALAGNEIAA